MKKIKNRFSNYNVHNIFLKRWSPRAMSGEPISNEVLFTLFEAARWAPSSYNNQPWRFIYSLRNDENWDDFFSLLGQFNQSWCKNASALIVVISAENFEYNDKPSLTHSFDTGAAWENLALQAAFMNLVAHGMQGFDYNLAKKQLNIPDDYHIEIMIAVGKPGKKSNLPKELQKLEKPSVRKELEEIVMEGKFRF